MKLNRLKFAYRENARSLHQKIGEVLRTSAIFSSYKIYQEYPVSQINSSYKNKQHKFDWVVLDLALVIEVHGQQHFFDTTFGGTPDQNKFLDIKKRDKTKRDAAIEVGFTYLEISYDKIKEIDDQFVYKLWQEQKNPMKLKKQLDQKKIKLSQWRKEQYRRKKIYLKGSG
jgi:hypothetical protein